MGRLRFAGVLFAVLGLVAAGCSKATPKSTSSTSPVASIPTATTITLPVTYGYYDGHIDTMISTDVSNKAMASASHINYSAALVVQAPNKFPALYQMAGPTAAGQPQVFGSQPGEDNYSPLWQEVTVRWKSGVKPVLLVKDDQIKDLASKGELMVSPTPVVLNCPIVKIG